MQPSWPTRSFSGPDLQRLARQARAARQTWGPTALTRACSTGLTALPELGPGCSSGFQAHPRPPPIGRALLAMTDPNPARDVGIAAAALVRSMLGRGSGSGPLLDERGTTAAGG
jgi:hypothetical protein